MDRKDAGIEIAMTLGFEGLDHADVNGARLAFHEQGSGEPMVLIHGSASDLRTWERLVPGLARRHRVIAYSRRYARPNADIEPGIDDPMGPHVEDLVAFLDMLKIARAHLVGHSWGGFIALLAAIGRPDRVHSLVLMEPPVLPLFVSTPPRLREILGLLARRPATALSIVKFGAAAFAPAQKAFRRGDDAAAMRAFGRGVLGAAGYAGLSEARLRQVRDNIATDRAQILGAGLPPLDDDDVRRMRVPTLLLMGERSPPFLHHLSNRLYELLPNAERAEIADASHLMHEDNADMVAARIADFVGDQGT